jgi:hypothetical protein
MKVPELKQKYVGKLATLTDVVSLIPEKGNNRNIIGLQKFTIIIFLNFRRAIYSPGWKIATVLSYRGIVEFVVNEVMLKMIFEWM